MIHIPSCEMATGRGTNITPVNFACQQCSMPLKLDISLSQLDERDIAELSVPLLMNSENVDMLAPAPERMRDDLTTDIFNKITKDSPGRLTDIGDGFMMVGESDERDMDSLSHMFKITTCLFDIMSGQSDVDHPLCEECTDALLDQMDAQLKLTEDECKDYNEFLEQLHKSTEKYNIEELESDLKKYKEEISDLQKQLEVVEVEKGQALLELDKQKEEKERLDAKEEHYWREYCNYKRQLLLFADEQRSTDNQLRYAQAQLNKLKRTNVFNASFHLWHNGQFGTINNFRLGRLPNITVEWHEINAAWGQTVLLLQSMAKKINLTFQRYRLVPYGNYSYLECMSDKSKELPLYGSGGIRFFWDTKFDQAMVAFLDCLQQFKEEVEKWDPGSKFILPYKMDKGRIADPKTGNTYSIKIQLNSEEQWTKALKLMLINLKWGLTWVSAHFTTKWLTE